MFFLGGNFVSSHICTLKSKKPKKPLKIPKNLKTFSKKTYVFQALRGTHGCSQEFVQRPKGPKFAANSPEWGRGSAGGAL